MLAISISPKNPTPIYPIMIFDADRRLHNLDGPAYDDGVSQWWYQHGIPHRIDGPAVVSVVSGKPSQQWYVNGSRCHSVSDFITASQLDYQTVVQLVLQWGSIK